MAKKKPGSTRQQDQAGSRAKGVGQYRPTREQILEFINENPGRSGKREIARGFSLKGEDRLWLNDELQAMEDDGVLKSQGKRFGNAGRLPPLSVLDIFGRERDGGLLAKPVERDGSSENLPIVSVKMPRHVKGPTPGVGDRILAKIFFVSGDEAIPYSGRVVKVLEKKQTAVLGILRKDGERYRIEGIDRRQPDVTLREEDLNGAQIGDLVEVETGRTNRYGQAVGKVAQVVGAQQSEKAISMIAIYAHDIPHIFPDAVITEAESAPAKVSLEGREDWRDLPLVTIDPADAKDHDDAVYAEPDTDEKNPGGVIATVAIADVAAYVRPGSALDREALKRGNSVYFPDRVVPMLPERISNDLCSLKEGVERPALAVRMTFASDGRKIRHSFHRVVMRSAAKLAYQAAQAAIDGTPNDVPESIRDTVLKPLWSAYEVLKRGRDRREPLELDLPERKILLTEDGRVDRVIIPERLDAHKLIEEFMIQANVCAAETLETRKQPLVYRVHDAPSLAKQETLREFLATIGLSLARGADLTPARFNGILSQVEGTDHEELASKVVLRSQSQAEYAPSNLGHFGLNLARYAHFTSPIRRYADLIVHRALISALDLGSDGLMRQEEQNLVEIAATVSTTERRAMAAERDTIDRLVATHLADHIGETFDGRISGVTKSGLFVQLPLYGTDGFIPISKLGNEYFHFDEAMQALIGEKSRAGYRLADHVEIKILDVLPMAGAMEFEMVSDPTPLQGSKQSHHKAKTQRMRARASQSGRHTRRKR
ncbi:ribonuclease R [Limoniibacter endophyticus]|uniref:Ribonuclease R n=1 Tax=Limoniibacter endophyticus TaxID=1565040 RepID=A0A8J3DKY5_9HYPH|nr:ribonuclease R [Limoniibacter endophyticus]GHC62328.1 ribonuclease R [Limoniibacter endophyticus]